MAPSTEEGQSPSEKADANETKKAPPGDDTNNQAQNHGFINARDVEGQTEKTEDGEGIGTKGFPPEDESQYPGPRSVALVVLAIYLAMFLVSLVRYFLYISTGKAPSTDRAHRTVQS